MIKYQENLVIMRKDINFDEACRQARELTLIQLGIDADGHSKRHKNFIRSEDSVFIRFRSFELSLSMMGDEVAYLFDIGFESGEEE